MALQPPAPAGGGSVRRRNRPDDGGREPAHSPAPLRSGGACGRSAHRAGRGRRQKHERLPGLRGSDVKRCSRAWWSRPPRLERPDDKEFYRIERELLRDGLTRRAQLTQLPAHEEGGPRLWAIGIDGESPLMRRDAEHYPLHVSLAFEDELSEEQKKALRAFSGSAFHAFHARCTPCLVLFAFGLFFWNSIYLDHFAWVLCIAEGQQGSVDFVEYNPCGRQTTTPCMSLSDGMPSRSSNRTAVQEQGCWRRQIGVPALLRRRGFTMTLHTCLGKFLFCWLPLLGFAYASKREVLPRVDITGGDDDDAGLQRSQETHQVVKNDASHPGPKSGGNGNNSQGPTAGMKMKYFLLALFLQCFSVVGVRVGGTPTVSSGASQVGSTVPKQNFDAKQCGGLNGFSLASKRAFRRARRRAAERGGTYYCC